MLAEPALAREPAAARPVTPMMMFSRYPGVKTVVVSPDVVNDRQGERARHSGEDHDRSPQCFPQRKCLLNRVSVAMAGGGTGLRRARCWSSGSGGVVRRLPTVGLPGMAGETVRLIWPMRREIPECRATECEFDDPNGGHTWRCRTRYSSLRSGRTPTTSAWRSTRRRTLTIRPAS